MINASTAMLRKLKEFFERSIGLHAWDRVTITHFGKTDDEDHEYVTLGFVHNAKRYELEAIGPEDAPPLGSVELRGGAQRITGVLSDETFARISRCLSAPAV